MHHLIDIIPQILAFGAIASVNGGLHKNPHLMRNKLRRGGPFSFHGGPGPHHPHPPPHHPYAGHGHHGPSPALFGPQHKPHATSYSFFSGLGGHHGHSLGGSHHPAHAASLGYAGAGLQRFPQSLGLSLEGHNGGLSLGQSLHALSSPGSVPELTVSPIIPLDYANEEPIYAQEPQIQAEPEPFEGPVEPLPPSSPGNSQISKSVYVFSAPPDPADRIRPQLVKKFPQERQKHYQVVFINAPNPPLPAQHTVELPSPPELKTQIYVLVKKPQATPPVKIIPAKVPVHKPEVYFIRYKNKDGG